MAMGKAKINKIDLLNDRYLSLPDKMKRYVDRSWAPEFYKEVTCKINQERFEVLYSDNPATRPSTPVNQIVAALIIKEMFAVTDEQLLDNIMTNITYQYALGLTSAEDIDFSDRTFGRFRARLKAYEEETGIDLIKEEQEEIADRFCGLLNISGRKKRMDSLMIESRGKYMTRLEIIHTTVAKALHILDKEKIPNELLHYLEKDDTNKIIYHQKEEELEPRLQTAINDAFQAEKLLKENNLEETYEYRILARMIGDQTIDGVLKNKEDIKPDSLQNPNDPDETYRHKAGTNHHGYVGNVTQAYNEDGVSIITECDYKPNTYSDSAFMKDHIAKKKDNSPEEIITDGAYQSAENDRMAEEAGITHKATSLTGGIVDPVFTEFELNEDKTKIEKCPQGKEPIRQSLYKNGKTIRAVFSSADCNKECPFYDHCHPKEQKKGATAVTLNTESVERAQKAKQLDTEEYKQAARERNAVEGVPSVMRRRYDVDDIPVFGYIRSKLFFTFKVIACNVVSLITHLPKTREKCAQIALS